MSAHYADDPGYRLRPIGAAELRHGAAREGFDLWLNHMGYWWQDRVVRPSHGKHGGHPFVFAEHRIIESERLRLWGRA